MAIVFISAQKKQKVFFILITGALFLALIAISFYAFFPEIKSKFSALPDQQALEIPEVKVNFSIIDSKRVADLELFIPEGAEFTYTAKDNNQKNVSGKMFAKDKEEARQTLESRGLEIVTLEELTPGKSDPFVSYY